MVSSANIRNLLELSAMNAQNDVNNVSPIEGLKWGLKIRDIAMLIPAGNCRCSE